MTGTAQHKSCMHHFLTHWWTDQDEILYGVEEIRLNILILLLSRIWWNKGNNCFFCALKKRVWIFINGFGSNLVWLEILLKTPLWSIWFDSSLSDIDLYWRSQECEKAKTSVPIISQSFQSFWMVYCWDLLLCWISYSCYHVRSIFREENPTFVISWKQTKLCVGL